MHDNKKYTISFNHVSSTGILLQSSLHQRPPLHNRYLSTMATWGWSRELDDCGSISKKVLKRTRKAALSGTLNIALAFNVVN